MKRPIIFLTIAAFFLSAQQVPASSGHENGQAQAQMGMSDGKTFTHHAEVDGVKSEFQIMRLADMNMKNERGATHHIMVKLSDVRSSEEIKNAIGKIKIIAPDGKEQEGVLKNYSGVFAANFTFDKAGKYGVICLVKVDGRNKVMKFWYPHET